MRILVLGAGGIGGYFSGRLATGGADVTFLVREKRAGQLSARGLVIESPLGDLTASVKAVTSAGGLQPDIVMLACKAYALDGAVEAVSPAVRPGTIVLPLLNGVDHMARIAAALPEATVWGGLAHIGVTLRPDGVIEHLNGLHTLMFGTHGGGSHPMADALLDALTVAGVGGQLRENIDQDLWDKLVFLATLAGATCLMRANVGTILETDHGERLILGLLDECTRVAGAEGFAPDPEHMAAYRGQLTEPGSPATASMLRDINRGGPTEAEHILDDMVTRGVRHGVSTPLLEIALTHLQAYELSRV